jgi:hypothetical protein
MTKRQLISMIRTLERLEKANDLTGDGHHWLLNLRRELDRRFP